MAPWIQQLRYDPIATLLAARDRALSHFVQRDLLDEPGDDIASIWQLPTVQKILKKQLAEGSWKYPGKRDPLSYPAYHYELVETWRQFRILIDQYQLDHSHPAIRAAAEFLFSCQTETGDFRGFIGNQYASYYSGALTALLINAGYMADPRITRAMTWLMDMRQDDGAWTIPILTADISWDEQQRLTSREAEPLEPDRSRPFSHNWTGMILRAFAVHEKYRSRNEVQHAAMLLKSRFFKADCYPSYKAASYWVRFQFPFWWNNLVAALDSISLIDPIVDEETQAAIDWLVENQKPDGLWLESYVPGKTRTIANSLQRKLWITLAICRVLKRFAVEPEGNDAH